jgi:hypothetical protein
MSDTNRSGTILIADATSLPATLWIESQVFVPGWRVVKNLDRYALARQIEAANWNFFYLAGEMRTTVLGRDGSGTLRRAVKQILAKQKGQKFNSLEITKVVSKRFLGIAFTSVTAHSRHIQQGLGLVPATDFVLRMPAPLDRVTTRQYTSLISSA